MKRRYVFHGAKRYSWVPRSTLSDATYAAIVALRKRQYLVEPHGQSHHRIRHHRVPWRIVASATLRKMVG